VPTPPPPYSIPDIILYLRSPHSAEQACEKFGITPSQFKWAIAVIRRTHEVIPTRMGGNHARSRYEVLQERKEKR